MPHLKRALAFVLVMVGILLTTESGPAMATPTSEAHSSSIGTIHCC